MDVKNLHLIFWQPNKNIHEAAYIKRLSFIVGRVTVVYKGDFSRERQSVGFDNVDYGCANLIRCTDCSSLPAAALDSSSNAVHLLTGIRSFELTSAAFNILKKFNVRIFLISEARNFLGIRGAIKVVESIIYEQEIHSRLNGVLAMGRLGCRWFKRAGYPVTKIYPFCYAVEYDATPFSSRCDFDGECFRVVYIGQLIQRKSVNLLFEALKTFSPRARRELLVVGDGPQLSDLKIQARDLVDTWCVDFLMPMHNKMINGLLRSCDILVLPSRWDGWGVVVNEALHAGCKVVVSNCCGSENLVNSMCGAVFKSGNLKSLRGALSAVAAMPNDIEHRNRVIAYSSEFSPERMANYLLDILAGRIDGDPSLQPKWMT